MSKKILWMKKKVMKKFHAFTLDNGASLCGKWFMGGACNGDDWHPNYGENSKCVSCIKQSRQNFSSEMRK